MSKCHFARGLEMGTRMFPSSSSFSSTSSCKAFLHKGPKVLFLDHLKIIQNTFKCEMFGENTWGSGVRSGSGCQQDDADTHQVGSKTCDQLLPWRIILGQICVSRWRCCRSWNRLLWDLQFFATSPTLILRCFFATGSLVLNSGSHFLGALRARSIR